MDQVIDGEHLERVILQTLESLQRAGLSELPRRSAWSTAAESPSTVELKPATPPERVSSPAAQEDLVTRAEPITPAREPKIAQPPQESLMAKRDTLEQRRTALAVIEKEVVACQRCPHLACSRTKTVFGVGNIKPRLCFFGEAPGADEDRTGEPFVGRAGQLLTDIIQKGMSLQRSDVYILNVLKCRPPDNRTPNDDEIASCREFFERQFQVLQPEFICCLGATAARALLETKQSLGRLRGQWFDYRGSRAMVTYHPSYLLRNPPAKKDTWEDIQMLMREMGLPINKKD